GLSLLRLWNDAEHSRGRDFFQFWAAGQFLRARHADLYSDDARERIGRAFHAEPNADPSGSRHRAVSELRRSLETYSTPFLYAVFGLTASGDYEGDYQRYVLVCLAFGAGALLILGHVLGYDRETAIAAAALFLGWFEPIQLDIRVGNVNALQV